MRKKMALILTVIISFSLIANLQANESETKAITALGSSRIDPNLEPIVNHLLSANEDDFWTGIEAACMLSERGTNKGVLAIQEAIIRKTANVECKFFKPGPIKRTVEERKSSGDELIALAKERSLLKDTYQTGNLISAFYAFYGDRKIQGLSEKIKDAGGKDEYCAFILLFNEMWCDRQAKKNK